jgi:FliI/YscN family ATPase
MERRRVSRPVALGIRAMDACLTVGEGQRLAIMAGPGVGKSVLLGMLARSADADVVVATSDESPLKRVRAGMAATAIAEHFRERGRRVVLLVDSLSRVAMAQREIGLAAGEPPTTKGYPPSAFAVIPRLTERAGNDAGRGSITAFYTVLAEGDELTDPIADAAKATLDGHVVLSRRLAESGHFPAIDVLSSVSRVMSDVATPEHRELARQARDVLAAYRDAADLIEVGAYAAGSNPRVDRALRVHAALNAFMRQSPEERSPLAETLSRLSQVIAGGDAAHA